MAAKKTTPVQAKGENINVRVTPKIRFGIELLARKQRRNISSVVEWALQKAMNDPIEGLIEPDPEAIGTTINILQLLWDVDEFDRIYYMAAFKEDLLTYEEERLIKLIRESELADYFHETIREQTNVPRMRTRLFCEYMREHYPVFKKIDAGELSKDHLPKPPAGWKSKHNLKKD
jgi:hypothetical protein